mgnify:CR=1 FL=1
MDFCGLFENLLEYVRRMEAIRLSGDKVKPHNQVKKNWLCGLKVVLTATKMYVRKLSFGTFVKFVQKTIAQFAKADGWVDCQHLLQQMQKDKVYFNLQTFGYQHIDDALYAIHEGWVEFSKDKKKVRNIRLMP